VNRPLIAACALVIACAIAPVPAYAARSAAAIASELAAVRGKVTTAGRQYDKALAALENTDDKIKSTDKRMKAEAKNLAGAEALLGERVSAIYRSSDEFGMLTFMLGATTFEDFITRADLVEIIGDRDASLVAAVKDTRSRLEQNRKTLSTSRKKQSADLAAFKKRRNALQTELQKIQAQYARLLGELAAAMEREKAAGHITYTPKGPNGMVFPVRGAHYYSNTWGAARSGGRRHRGTDVMSPRGTPCVAISSGTVRAHSSGLGGLSITLTGDNGWTYYYAHLNGYAVRSGHVRAGQLIGYVGSTGNARGGAPHLHLQMGPSGRWVNPYPYLRQME
jgi:murein DD-endopeptidase MepM/ murein hydrolase activator NlpD